MPQRNPIGVAEKALGIPPAAFEDALRQYRQDVPSVGANSEQEVQQLLEQGRICRGWMSRTGGKLYFHIVKSPTEFPSKALMTAATERELFAMTVMLGMEHEVAFEDLVSG